MSMMQLNKCFVLLTRIHMILQNAKAKKVVGRYLCVVDHQAEMTASPMLGPGCGAPDFGGDGVAAAPAPAGRCPAASCNNIQQL